MCECARAREAKKNTAWERADLRVRRKGPSDRGARKRTRKRHRKRGTETGAAGGGVGWGVVDESETCHENYFGGSILEHGRPACTNPDMCVCVCVCVCVRVQIDAHIHVLLYVNVLVSVCVLAHVHV